MPGVTPRSEHTKLADANSNPVGFVHFMSYGSAWTGDVIGLRNAKAILTLADDRVRRGKELRKVKGTLRAALKRGDLMEAEQVRKVMTENFDVTGLEDDSTSDPETAADDCDSTTSSTARSNTGTGETTTAPTTSLR